MISPANSLLLQPDSGMMEASIKDAPPAMLTTSEGLDKGEWTPMSVPHDSTGYPQYPRNSELPRPENMYPCDIEEQEYAEFCAWYRGSDADTLREVFWDFAGAATDSLIAIVGLYALPEYNFDEPWLLEMEERHGGPAWINDFDLNVAVLREDMELWIQLRKVAEVLQHRFGYDICDPGPKGLVLELAERWLGKIIEAYPHGDTGGRYWFRIDWPTLITWWRDARRKIENRFEPDGFVYVLGAPDFYKIGKAKNLDSRVKQLAIQLPWAVDVVHSIPCEGYSESEQALHRRFADRRANGEWFMLTPDDVSWIKRITRMWGDRAEFEGGDE